MRVLVTGATGFVGTHLVPVLAISDDVICAVRPGSTRRLAATVETWEIDLEEGSFRPITLPGEVEAILHLAQAPAGSADEGLFAINTASTMRLAAAARRAGVQQFVLASTASVYRRSEEPIKEDAALEPADVYGASKLASEVVASAYRTAFGVGIVRIVAPYGPGQRDRLLPRIVDKVITGEPITVGRHSPLRVNPIYIDDLVRVLIAGLKRRDSFTINAAGPDTVSVAEIAMTAGHLLGRSPSIEEVDRPPEGSLVADTDRMRAMFGDVASTPLLYGLDATIRARTTIGADV